jgi:hypothetical protein
MVAAEQAAMCDESSKKTTVRETPLCGRFYYFSAALP